MQREDPRRRGAGASPTCPPEEYLDTDVAAWATVGRSALNSFRPQVEKNVRLVSALM